MWKKLSRSEIIKSIVESDKLCIPPNPLVLHWIGKLLPNIIGCVENVYRIVAIVTQSEVEKLSTIPAVEKGTEQEQTTVCSPTLED